ESMPVIEQAKGIIMAQSRCGEAQAFDLLRRASQRSNVPVRELAAQIVAKAAQGPPKRMRRGSPGAPAAPNAPGPPPAPPLPPRLLGAPSAAGRIPSAPPPETAAPPGSHPAPGDHDRGSQQEDDRRRPAGAERGHRQAEDEDKDDVPPTMGTAPVQPPYLAGP